MSTYSIRTAATREGKVTAYGFTVPRELAEAIGAEARFVPELTEDGILYRFVGYGEDVSAPLDLPSWAKAT